MLIGSVRPNKDESITLSLGGDSIQVCTLVRHSLILYYLSYCFLLFTLTVLFDLFFKIIFVKNLLKMVYFGVQSFVISEQIYGHMTMNVSTEC